MNPESREPWRPEFLAGYADEELGPHDRATVEAWLADHSETAGEVEALQRLARLFGTAAPAPPRESAWHSIFQSICARLPQPAHALGALARPRRRWA